MIKNNCTYDFVGIINSLGLVILFILSLLFVKCSDLKEEDVANGTSLQLIDSLQLGGNDSILFLPGYVYSGDDYYYYINVRPPFTTHKFTQTGQFVDYFNGHGPEKNDLPFFANGLVPIEDNGVVFFTGALMHLVSYSGDGIQTKEILVTDNKSNPIFTQYRMSNDTHIMYYDNGLFILPLENNKDDHYQKEYYSGNTIGIVDSTGTMINIFGSYDPIYKEKIIPYRSVPLLAVDKKNDVIYNSFGASDKIYKYNYSGDLVSVFGEKGQYINNHNFPNQSNTDDELWMSNWHSTPIYNSLFYDKYRDLLYRIYAVDTPTGEIEKLGNLLNKDAYLQVYAGEKLLGEIKLPPMLRWKVLRTDKDENLFFASKYYYDRNEEQQTWIYKVGFSLDDLSLIKPAD